MEQQSAIKLFEGKKVRTLWDEVIESIKRELNSDLKKAFKLLQKYHIDYTDLEKLVETKIASAGDEH